MLAFIFETVFCIPCDLFEDFPKRICSHFFELTKNLKITEILNGKHNQIVYSQNIKVIEADEPYNLIYLFTFKS